MAYKLLGQDAALQITFGGSALGGGAPTYGSANELITTGLAKEWGIDGTVTTRDMAGAGNTRERHRVKRGKTVISIQKFVLSTGAIGNNMEGAYAKVQAKELSSIGSYLGDGTNGYQGVVTHWKVGSSDGDEWIEEIEVTCDAEHA